MSATDTEVQSKPSSGCGEQLGKRDIPNDAGSSSTSQRKLTEGVSSTAKPLNIAYEILNFATVFNAIRENVQCRSCQSAVEFSAVEHVGLGFRIKMECSKCQPRYVDSSPKISSQSYEINTRLAFAMMMLGIGYSEIVKFCGLMDLPRFLTCKLYDMVVKCIQHAASGVAQMSMMRAVIEEVELNGDADSIIVSSNCSLKWLEYQASYGIAAVNGYLTGKVLDVSTNTLYCLTCQELEHRCDLSEYCKWLTDHRETCSCKDQSCIAKMNIDGVCDIFQRSVEKYGIKYKHYIIAEDRTTFLAIESLKPYGPDFQIYEDICVRYGQSRMAVSLYERKTSVRFCNLEGIDEFTTALIEKLTFYYGQAIESNNTVESMLNAIRATLCHLQSTDDNPHHVYCPAGPESWCKWRRAEAHGTLAEYKHEPSLHANVHHAIAAPHVLLSRDYVLKYYMGHFTRNTNESFHSLVSQISREGSSNSGDIVPIATSIAVAIFNDGYTEVLRIMSQLGLETGLRATEMARAEQIPITGRKPRFRNDSPTLMFRRY